MHVLTSIHTIPDCILKLIKTLSDSSSIHKKMHPCLIILVSYFHLDHLYFQQEITFWLIHLTMTYVGFTYIYKMFPILISLILSNIVLCNCLLAFWLATVALMNPFKFPTIYEQQLVLCRQGRFRFVFIISNQGCQFFVEILSFGFCVVNVECDAYVAMQQLITVQFMAIPYTLKMFLPFSSLILTA